MVFLRLRTNLKKVGKLESFSIPTIRGQRHFTVNYKIIKLKHGQLFGVSIQNKHGTKN